MKKFAFIISIIALMACLFAFSASAAVTGSASDEFGEVTEVDLSGTGINVYVKDKTARVVLKNDDDTYSTYYVYYIFQDFDMYGSMSTPNFTYLNKALGTSYKSSSVIRIEILSDYEGSELKLPSDFANSLKEIYIPEDIRSIKILNLKYTALEKIHISSSVTSIAASVFEGATSLKYVTFGENFSMTSLPDYMFKNCSSLVEIRLPDSVTSAGKQFFNGCSSLEKVVLGEKFDTFGTSAFPDVKNLKVYATSSFFASKAPVGMSFGATSNTPTDVILYFIGTREEAEALASKSKHTPLKKAALVQCNGLMTDDEYIDENRASWTIVYGYSKCEAYYGGHIIEEEYALNCPDLTQNMQVVKRCTRQCGVDMVYEEYAPVFVGVKYSVKEDGSAVCAKYAINTESVEVYKQYNGNAALSYGFVVSTGLNDGETLLSLGENGEIINNKVGAQFVNLTGDYTSFDFVLRGFNESVYDTKLIFCTYTLIDENIYYIGTQSSETPIEVTLGEIFSKFN